MKLYHQLCQLLMPVQLWYRKPGDPAFKLSPSPFVVTETCHKVEMRSAAHFAEEGKLVRILYVPTGEYVEWDGYMAKPTDSLRGGQTIVSLPYENHTEEPHLLKRGYRTSANGYADSITCPPHCRILCTFGGNAMSFARYQVEPIKIGE